MTIRTITQLPETNNTGIMLSSFMEMSVPDQTIGTPKFVSKKVKYNTIVNDIKDQTKKTIENEYALSSSSGKVNVSDLQSKVNDMMSADYEFDGAKGFDKWPYVQADFPTASMLSTASYNQLYGNDGNYILPNMKKVREMIEDNSVFMSTTDSLVAEGNPLPAHSNSATEDTVSESLEYTNTIGSGKFYYWHIDAQQNDSSTSIHDTNSGSTDGYEEIRDTGNLVMWGWVADNPEPNVPQPEQCWIGLFAKLKCEGGDSTEVDVPVSIQPWIRGKNASTIQYVSFNIPVRKGLRLKVKTGFPVNGDNSGLQNPGSLTFLDKDSANAFFGYVIK